MIGMFLLVTIGGVALNANAQIPALDHSINWIKGSPEEGEGQLITVYYDGTQMPYDFRYERNWPVYVDGVKRGEMPFLRPVDWDNHYNHGLTFAAPTYYRDWGTAFNGNPDYVESTLQNLHSDDKTTWKIWDGLSNPIVEMVHSRQLGQLTGAVVSQRVHADGYNYVHVETTPFPTGSIQAPSQVTEGEAFHVQLTAEEFNPWQDYIEWDIYEGSTLLTSGSVSQSSISDRTETITLNQPGTRQLRVVFRDRVERSTEAFATVNVNALPTRPPNADFDFSPSFPFPEPGQSVSFSDQSTHPDGLNIVSWRWYQDGTFFSSQRNPTRTFSEEGTYNIRLVVEDEKGQKDQITKAVRVAVNDPDDPYGPPKADFSYDPTTIYEGDSVTFTDESTHPSGLQIVKWGWHINDAFLLPNQNITIPFNTAGTYDMKLVVEDEKGKTDQITKTITVLEEAAPPPEPEPPVINNEPPVAIITGPTSVKAGTWASFSGANSYDVDGAIIQYSWQVPRAEHSISGVSGSTMWMKEGTYTINLGVQDDVGDWGYASHTVNVLPPTPNASFNVGGKLKQNRGVYLRNTSTSPTMYPIDWSKSYWEIQAIDSNNQDAIRHLGTLNDKDIDSLFKKPGDYRVRLHVTNTAGYTDTTSRIITIVEDLPPVVDLEMVTTVYRDPDNNNMARIFSRSNAKSIDGDWIARVIFEVTFDANNDGIFDDEPMIFDSDKMPFGEQIEFIHPTNGMKIKATMYKDYNLEILTPHVGEYRIEVTAVEGFDI